MTQPAIKTSSPGLVKPSSFEHGIFSAADFTCGGAELIAVEILRALDGMTVGQVRQVLTAAERLMNSTARVDAASSDFRQAAEGCLLAVGRSR